MVKTEHKSNRYKVFKSHTMGCAEVDTKDP